MRLRVAVYTKNRTKSETFLLGIDEIILSTDKLLLLAGDGLDLTLASPRVGLGALASARKTADVPPAAVALNLFEPFDVEHVEPSEVTLDHVRVNLRAQDGEFFLFHLAHAFVLQARLGHDLLRAGVADAVDVGERDFRPFVVGDLHTRDARRANLKLPALHTADLWIDVGGMWTRRDCQRVDDEI